MNIKFKKNLALILTLTTFLTLIGLFYLNFLPLQANAQANPAGGGSAIGNLEQQIDSFGSSAGLNASQDPRTTIAKIIYSVLGILGILLTILIIWGGFIWMTAGGNEQKVEQAKKILTNSAIGLLIIVVAYGITKYVFDVIIWAYY